MKNLHPKVESRKQRHRKFPFLFPRIIFVFPASAVHCVFYNTWSSSHFHSFCSLHLFAHKKCNIKVFYYLSFVVNGRFITVPLSFVCGRRRCAMPKKQNRKMYRVIDEFHTHTHTRTRSRQTSDLVWRLDVLKCCIRILLQTAAFDVRATTVLFYGSIVIASPSTGKMLAFTLERYYDEPHACLILKKLFSNSFFASLGMQTRQAPTNHIE